MQAESARHCSRIAPLSSLEFAVQHGEQPFDQAICQWLADHAGEAQPSDLDSDCPDGNNDRPQGLAVDGKRRRDHPDATSPTATGYGRREFRSSKVAAVDKKLDSLHHHGATVADGYTAAAIKKTGKSRGSYMPSPTSRYGRLRRKTSTTTCADNGP